MAWKTSVLVVANQTAGSDELFDNLRARAARGPSTFTFVVPATGGAPGGRQAARARLTSALERMREAGLEAYGNVGDPDPLVAVKEAFDPTAFDEIVVCTLPGDASRWLLVDLPHRLERMTGVPVAHVSAAEPQAAPATVPPPRHEQHGLLSPLAALGWGRDQEAGR